MADPLNGAYYTAANKYAAADGTTINIDPNPSAWTQAYGNDATVVWAEYRNVALLKAGQAIMTPQGVIALQSIINQLKAKGYNGPWDPASVAQAYGLLQTAPPGPPAPPGNAPLSGLPRVSPQVLIVAAVGVYLFMQMGKRR